MRNLENIDLDTLDHVTGGCGGGGQQAAQQTPPVAEQHHGNATTLVGFPVHADKPTKTMSDYGVPSLTAFTEYAPAADTGNTSTVQSSTADDGDGNGDGSGDGDGSGHQAGHGRFGGMGFGHHAASADDATEEAAAPPAPQSDWADAMNALGYAMGSPPPPAEDGAYLPAPMMPTNGGFAHADVQSQTASTADDDGTGAMVCGVMPPGTGTDGSDGADGSVAAEAGVSGHHTGLGSFHEVDRGATSSMVFGGQFEQAGADPAQYSLNADLGGHGSVQVANGDVNVDVDTPVGGLHLGYNGGQFGVSLNRN